MEFRTIRALRGPNPWADVPVLEAEVVLQELRDATPEMIPGFADRLAARLPDSAPIGRGAGLVDVLAQSALGLQRLAGLVVGFVASREESTTSAPSATRLVAVEYVEEPLGRAALEAAHRLVLAAVYDRPFDRKTEVELLRDMAHDICLGPSTGSIVRAALKRGIPFRRLNEGSLVQFGQGVHQRRILTAETDGTGAIAEAIAKDKELTRGLLQAVGVPVPRGRAVADPDDAWRAALEVGVPVVIKPRDGNQGRGVATNLTTREQVAAAYQNAVEEGNGVLVEQFARGYDHRLLVVGERLIAAARREPAHVLGDGWSTIQELVRVVNRDPRRSDGHSTALSHIRLDPIALAVLGEQGYIPESIPPAGQRVLIRRNANLSTGGTATDVTDQVHPAVAACAVDAARVVGLDIAGIDLVIEDVGRPMEEQGGMIVEVNAGPGLRMHLEPSEGTPRPVGEAIVATLFPEGQSGRVPTVGLIAADGPSDVASIVARALAESGLSVGQTGPEGVTVNRRRVIGAIGNGPEGARALMLNPRVEAAVLEVSADSIRRQGLGLDRLNVAVVTRPNDLAAEATLIRSAGAAVLRAGDPNSAGLASACRGVVVLFARDASEASLADHRARGGRAVFARGGAIVLAEGDSEHDLIPLARVPAARSADRLDDALAAAAAGWMLGLRNAEIRSALEAFDARADLTLEPEVAPASATTRPEDSGVGPALYAVPVRSEEGHVVFGH